MCVSQFRCIWYSSTVPALPPVPGVIRVQWRWTSGSDLDVVSRIYLAYTGTAPTDADMVTFAGTTNNHMASRFDTYWTPDVTLTECTCVDLSSPTAGIGVQTSSYGGTLSGAELPAQSCCLVNFAIQRRYRGGKPRAYFPFGSATTLNGKQQWTSTFQTNVTSQYAALITDIQGSPPGSATISGQVNVSYYEGFTVFTTPSGRAKNISTLRPGGPHVDVVTGATANIKVASQRRRIAA